LGIRTPQALQLGRSAAVDQAVSHDVERKEAPETHSILPLRTLVADRRKRLVEYQNEHYADRYTRRLHNVQTAEHSKAPGQEGLAHAVAHNYAKLMMYKDEYEVARLYGSYRAELAREFNGPVRFKILLAPPALAMRRITSAEPRKRAFGPWILTVFRLLAHMKRLRGTPFDLFGRTEERRIERRLVTDYETLLDELTTDLTPENYSTAIRLASLPEQIRGFGHVKSRAIQDVRKTQEALLREFRKSETSATKP